MLISSLLDTERVFSDVEISSKKRLLEYIAEQAESQLDLSKATIYNQLLDRERLGSTGLGEGIAVPHARLKDLQQTHACLIRLKEGINYDAADRKPVDLVFTLLIPEQSTEEHLQILASLARLFSNRAVADAVRGCTSTAAVLQQILSAEQHEAE